ncbi:MAG: glutathione S-transferase [Rhizobiales bacterium]|nr:glutathione S-transferase [Hyphomicrobiales bacterium]
MTDTVAFYTNPMSRGRIVRWMLEEVGCPYEVHPLAYGTTMKAPAYLAINPMGKVPAIVHRGVVVTEAPAICAYLADAYPEAGLAPAIGDPRRGTYYRAMFFAAGPLEAAVTNKALGVSVPPDKKGMVGYGSLEEVVEALAGMLEGRPYLLGDGFSAADVYVGAHIGWGMQFGTIEPRPVFEAYHERLSARPAAVRAREADDALLAEHPVTPPAAG